MKAIPGGAHTYSRGHDQYPSNAPALLESGSGAYTFTPDGEQFVDYGMALRAVHLGYANDSVDAAAITAIRKGNNLTRPSTVELEAAERLISLIDSVDMVKFTKNGSTAVTAAVKLARAYTGKNIVVRCAQQPFFSFDDWFISSTPTSRGIPEDVAQHTKSFNYNDIESLKSILDEYAGQVACVILEPSSTECPAGSSTGFRCCDSYPHLEAEYAKRNFLQQVEDLCRAQDVVFVLDEMITGFRWDIGGAQKLYGVTPDLSTFGKAMANGYSVAAIAGRREIMELGGIENEGAERVFLLSTTHGAEMAGLAAFSAVADFMSEEPVTEHLWSYGAQLTERFNAAAAKFDLVDQLKMAGPSCSPYYVTRDQNLQVSAGFRTLFAQEMLRSKILMPWVALSYSHGPDELEASSTAFEKAMIVYSKALEEGLENYLVGEAIKPVFRKYN